MSYDAYTPDQQCIFCEIIAGNMQTPGIFWEDDAYMAWLAIDPNTEGYSCVVPKTHAHSDILKLPDDQLQSFILAAKKVAAILEAHFPDVGRVGLIMEGTGINHAHIKLIPMHQTQYLKNGGWKQILSTSKPLWFEQYEGWLSSGGGAMADPKDLAQLAADLKKTVRTMSE